MLNCPWEDEDQLHMTDWMTSVLGGGYRMVACMLMTLHVFDAKTTSYTPPHQFNHTKRLLWSDPMAIKKPTNCFPTFSRLASSHGYRIELKQSSQKTNSGSDLMSSPEVACMGQQYFGSRPGPTRVWAEGD
jgi:hypothetical protein